MVLRYFDSSTGNVRPISRLANHVGICAVLSSCFTMGFLPRRSRSQLAIRALVGLCVVATLIPSFENDLQHYELLSTSTINMPKESPEVVRVYYNLFVSNQADSDRVYRIFTEQYELLQPVHRMYINSIGYPLALPNSTTLLQHSKTGDEKETLHLLWDYCNKNPASKVVYLHSKGSFHPNPDNEKFRRFLTRGALSEECLSLPAACNVCASRASPIPHPHVPGNMFLARCNYIRKLIDPLLFEAKMRTVTSMPPNGESPSCYGLSRFAAEHWILSHPLAMPCDLSQDTYVWSQKNIPDYEWDKEMAMMPRFEPSAYRLRLCYNYSTPIGFSLKDRLQEYQDLYNATPTESWWGWSR